MSDIAVAEIPVDDGEQALPVLTAPEKNSTRNVLVEGPILRTLLRLAWPNVIALSAGTCVVITLPKREPPALVAAEIKAQDNV